MSQNGCGCGRSPTGSVLAGTVLAEEDYKRTFRIRTKVKGKKH